MRRSGVYAVRVQNERHTADGKDRLHQPRQFLRAAKTGAEQHSVHFGKPRCNRRQRGHAEPPCLVARERKDDLAPRACGDDRIDFLRHAEIHKAAARAECGLCRKPCRAGQSLGAAEQKDSAVITLVALPPPDRQQLPNQLPVRALRCPCRSFHFRSPPYYKFETVNKLSGSCRNFSGLFVGADAHIGPLGSCEFAEDCRKMQCNLRADRVVRPYMVRRSNMRRRGRRLCRPIGQLRIRRRVP